MKLPKYSIYFLFFIIVSKLVYLVFEAYYNGHLIEIVSNPNISIDIFKNIEQLGHNISAIGITLLLTPFAYLIIKKIVQNKSIIIFVSVSIFMVISFFSFQSLLTKVMDDLVKSNSDKRYSSYYISIFKYGMLNNYMGYETFIPKDRLVNPTIEDRIMISNMFLLTLVDSSLTDKLINKGGNIFTDLVIKKYSWDHYKKHEESFNNKIEDIHKIYNEYIDKSKKINTEFKKVDNREMMQVSYRDFISTIKSKYHQYDNDVIEYKDALYPSSSKINEYNINLRKYFRYSKYSKAQRKYRQSMINNFGKYIEPSRWLPKNAKYPNNKSIRKVIFEEVNKKWYDKSHGIPPNLSEIQFYRNYIVKRKIIKELRNKGLNVSNSFDYSKKLYFNAYQKKVDMEFKKTKLKFIKEFEKTSGKRFKFGLTYKQFLKYFKNDFIKKYDKKFGIILYDLVANNETDKFYKRFYLPYFKEKKLSDYLLSKEDMNTKKNKLKGDTAIKLLYIPPFAIAVSILAGILNIVSVVATLLFLIIPIAKLSSVSKFTVKLLFKTSLIAIIIYYPYRISQDENILKSYAILNSLDSKINKNYIYFLEWLMVVEKYNYNYIYKYIKQYK